MYLMKTSWRYVHDQCWFFWVLKEWQCRSCWLWLCTATLQNNIHSAQSHCISQLVSITSSEKEKVWLCKIILNQSEPKSSFFQTLLQEADKAYQIIHVKLCWMSLRWALQSTNGWVADVKYYALWASYSNPTVVQTKETSLYLQIHG